MPALPPELAIGTLRLVRDLACRIGDELVALAGDLRQASDKDGVDLVTKADQHSERALTAALHAHFPAHRIVAEEGTVLGPADAAWTWHIDPLDGTANYSRGLPAWALSIGLAHGDTPVLGCIHAPVAGMTVFGALGLGAWHGETPLPPATPAGATKTWIVATDWPWDLDERQRSVRLLQRMAPHIRQYKTVGSAAVDLAHLAIGRIDAYAISHIFRWDQCGGAAVLQTLGYDLRAWDGRPWSLADRDIIACRPGMADQLVAWCGR